MFSYQNFEISPLDINQMYAQHTFNMQPFNATLFMCINVIPIQNWSTPLTWWSRTSRALFWRRKHPRRKTTGWLHSSRYTCAGVSSSFQMSFTTKSNTENYYLHGVDPLGFLCCSHCIQFNGVVITSHWSVRREQHRNPRGPTPWFIQMWFTKT